MNDLGIKAPSHKRLLRALRKTVVSTLGVNNPQEVLDHTVSNACFELQALSALLREGDADRDAAMAAGWALRGIADRLQLARDLNDGLFDPDHPENTVMLNGDGAGDDKP